jgi:hypothetical protein
VSHGDLRADETFYVRNGLCHYTMASLFSGVPLAYLSSKILELFGL